MMMQQAKYDAFSDFMRWNHGGCFEYDDRPEVTKSDHGGGVGLSLFRIDHEYRPFQGSGRIYIAGLVGGLLYGVRITGG